MQPEQRVFFGCFRGMNLMKRRYILQLGLSGLAAGAVITSASEAYAMGNSKTTSTVSISCTGEGDAAQHSTLCKAMIESLSATHPNRVFAMQAEGAATNLTLTITKLSNTAISGYIAWGGAATGRGKEMTTGIRGADLGPIQLEMFVNSLLKATELPI